MEDNGQDMDLVAHLEQLYESFHGSDERFVIDLRKADGGEPIEKAPSTPGGEPAPAPGGKPAGRKKKEDGKSRDESGHVAKAGGGREDPKEVGKHGGKFYYNKQGHVVYGDKKPPRESGFTGEVKKETQYSPDEMKGFEEAGIKPINLDDLYRDYSMLYGFSEEHAFGKDQEKELGKLLGKDMLYRGGREKVLGKRLLQSVVARVMHKSVYDLPDLHRVASYARRMGFTFKQTFILFAKESFAQQYGSHPDIERQGHEHAEKLFHEFVGAHQKVFENELMIKVAKTQLRRKLGLDKRAETRLGKYGKNLDQFSENVVSGKHDFHALTLQALTLAGNLGLTFRPKTPEDIPQIRDKNGVEIKSDQQLQNLGTIYVNETEIAALTKWLENAPPGTPGAKGLAVILPILAKYSAYNKAMLAETSGTAEKLVAGFDKPDGSPREDFVSNATGDQLYMATHYREQDRFWQKPTWSDDQDNGLMRAMKNGLGIGDDQAKTYAAEINRFGKSFYDTLSAYNSQKIEEMGYGLVHSFMTDSELTDDAPFKDQGLVQRLVRQVAEYKQYVVDCLKAQVSDWRTFKTPEVWNGKWKPLPHQARAVEWMMTVKRGLLGYGTGMGKTPIAIMAAMKLQESGASKRTILVLPKTLTGQWPGEIRKFIGKGKKVVMIGGADDGIYNMDMPRRIAMLQKIQSGAIKADFVILSASTMDYTPETREKMQAHGLHDDGADEMPINERRASKAELLADDPVVKALRELEGALIVDEAHDASMGLKKPDNDGHMIMEHMLKGREHAWFMTATPAPNNVRDLYHLMSLIKPGSAGSSVAEFTKKNSRLTPVYEFNKDGSPVLDPDSGLPKMRWEMQYSQEYAAKNAELKPFLFMAQKDDPEVLKAMEDAGMALPKLDVKRKILPLDREHQELLGRIHDGMDHPVRLEAAKQENWDKLTNFKKRLQKFVEQEGIDLGGTDYMNMGLDEFQQLDGIRDASGRLLNIKMPTFAKPLTWEQASKGEESSLMYRSMMAHQALLHPGLVDPSWGDKPSPKIDQAVQEVLNHFNDKGHEQECHVIFAREVSVFKEMRRRLVKAGINPSLISEITGGGDDEIDDPRIAKDRSAIAAAANEGKIKVLLVGINAGGVGLNLNGSGVGIGPTRSTWLEEPWTSAEVDQGMARVWRTGQRNTVINTFLSANEAADFHRLKAIKTKMDAFLLIERQSEKTAGEAQAGVQAEALVKELKKYGVLDQEGREFGPLNDEQMKQQLAKFGIGETKDYAHALSVLNKNFQFIPYRQHRAFQRMLHSGADQIAAALQAEKAMHPEGGEEYESNVRSLKKQLKFWYAGMSSAGDVPLLVSRRGVTPDKPEMGGYHVVAQKNPFRMYVKQKDGDVEEAQSADPDAELFHATRPGKEGRHTDYYLFDALSKYEVSSPEDFVDRVLKPIGENVGQWSPEWRSELVRDIADKFRAWEREGYIKSIGDKPKRRRTSPTGQLETSQPKVAAPAQQAGEKPGTLALPQAKKPQAPPTSGERLGVGTTPKAKEEPKFEPKTIEINGQQHAVSAELLGKYWKMFKKRVDGGATASSIDSIRRNIFGWDDPATTPAVKGIYEEFKRLGLVEGLDEHAEHELKKQPEPKAPKQKAPPHKIKKAKTEAKAAEAAVDKAMKEGAPAGHILDLKVQASEKGQAARELAAEETTAPGDDEAVTPKDEEPAKPAKGEITFGRMKEEKPKFTATDTLSAAALNTAWGSVHSHLEGGDKITSMEDFVSAAGLSPKNENHVEAAHAALKEFKRKGLLTGEFPEAKKEKPPPPTGKFSKKADQPGSDDATEEDTQPEEAEKKPAKTAPPGKQKAAPPTKAKSEGPDAGEDNLQQRRDAMARGDRKEWLRLHEQNRTDGKGAKKSAPPTAKKEKPQPPTKPTAKATFQDVDAGKHSIPAKLVGKYWKKLQGEKITSAEELHKATGWGKGYEKAAAALFNEYSRLGLVKAGKQKLAPPPTKAVASAAPAAAKLSKKGMDKPPKFDAVTVDFGDQEGEVDGKTIGKVWNAVRQHFRDGGTIAGAKDLHKLTGWGKEYKPVTEAMYKHFVEKDLLREAAPGGKGTGEGNGKPMRSGKGSGKALKAVDDSEAATPKEDDGEGDAEAKGKTEGAKRRAELDAKIKDLLQQLGPSTPEAQAKLKERDAEYEAKSKARRLENSKKFIKEHQAVYDDHKRRHLKRAERYEEAGLKDVAGAHRAAAKALDEGDHDKWIQYSDLASALRARHSLNKK